MLLQSEISWQFRVGIISARPYKWIKFTPEAKPIYTRGFKRYVKLEYLLPARLFSNGLYFVYSG